MITMLFYLIIFAACVVGGVFLIGWVISHFSQSNRAVRNSSKADKYALKAARERSTIAEQGLRDIANGAEYPIFVAEDALRQINNTYSKEIQ